MKALNIKVEGNLLREIDSVGRKHRYSTRTEFVREAIRDKLSKLEKEDMLKSLSKVQGISKHKTTDEQLHRAGEHVFNELEKKFKIR